MSWNDQDFVYFDPETKTVIKQVEWSNAGNIKPLQKPERPVAPGEQERRWHRKKEYYIWGSYGSLKRIYNLEGKQKNEEKTQTLDQAIERAMQEAYWDSGKSAVQPVVETKKE